MERRIIAAMPAPLLDRHAYLDLLQESNESWCREPILHARSPFGKRTVFGSAWRRAGQIKQSAER